VQVVEQGSGANTNLEDKWARLVLCVLMKRVILNVAMC
jgi:hypothetical protein